MTRLQIFRIKMTGKGAAAEHGIVTVEPEFKGVKVTDPLVKASGLQTLDVSSWSTKFRLSKTLKYH